MGVNTTRPQRHKNGEAPRRCVVERWDFTQAPGRFVRHGSDTLAFTDD